MATVIRSELETGKSEHDDPYKYVRPGIAEEIRMGITQPSHYERALDRTVTVEDVERMPIDVSDIGEAVPLVLWHYRIEVPIFSHQDDEALQAAKVEFETKMDVVKRTVIDGYEAKRRDVELLTSVLLAVFDPDKQRGQEYLEHIQKPIEDKLKEE